MSLGNLEVGVGKFLKRMWGVLKSRYQDFKNSNFSIQLHTSHFKISVFLLLVTGYWLLVTPTYAQESSPSASLLEKLNALKEDIASKAAQIKNEVNKKVQNKAIIGTILEISPTEIVIQTLNSAKTVRFDEFTEVIGSKNKKITIETLEEDDKVAALGDVDDKNNLVAQKIVYLEGNQTASNSAVLVWGQIQKSNNSAITIKTKTGQTENIFTNSQTQLFLGNEEASIDDAKVEQHLAARAVRLKDGSLRARFIYFIPSSGFTKPVEKSNPLLKSASPSASIKPSPKS